MTIQASIPVSLVRQTADVAQRKGATVISIIAAVPDVPPVG